VYPPRTAATAPRPASVLHRRDASGVHPFAWASTSAGARQRNPLVLKVETPRGHPLESFVDEGKNRQIRRMLSAVGLAIVKLSRVAVGGFQLGTLPEGNFSLLTFSNRTLLFNLPRTQAK
jgi:16S rRNA U516 pseudouridylate synthase RsuA-like enzyme